ncbi:hypothetical protein FJV41_49395, partial [Myxococcus llanfairpwllgwyngyllgogerychwyrndrobwllllantysiliogogogochensis]
MLAATPAAPLAPFIALFSRIMGGWISEAEQARVAQKYLRAAQDMALQHAYYEGYTGKYNQAVALWNVGQYEQADALLSVADAAGKANRFKVAQHIDATELASYRAWMAKLAPDASASKMDNHLWDGYLLGAAGITGEPNTRDFNHGSPGGWVQIRRADGVVIRWAARTGHPDYEGTVIPPLPPEVYEFYQAVRREKERRAWVEEATGQGPGGYINTVKEARRNGTYDEPQMEEGPPPAPPRPPAPPPPP